MKTSKSSKVSKTKVHPDVWARAMSAAAGDAKRIKVLSATAVRVVNK